MKLKLLALLSASLVYGNSDIDITSNQWQFLGLQQNTNLSELNLNSNDIIWNYKNNSWNCFKKDVDLSNICNEITSLNSGDGFWLYSNNSYKLSLEDNNSTIEEANLSKGWNMVTPIVNNMDINDMFSYKNVNSVWAYSDNKWLLWTPFKKYTNFTTLTKINKHQGFWVNSKSDIDGSKIYKDNSNYNYNSFVTFGDDKGGLKDGNFSTVIKSSTNDIKDIWNIRVKLDKNITNINNFNIGFKINKENGSYANVVYSGLNINNGEISTPKIIYINGKNSSGASTKTSSDNLPKLKAILKDTISLRNGILSLNFGTIIEADVSDSIKKDSFKTKAKYEIKISSNKLSFQDSKTASIGTLITVPLNISYSNTSTIEGSLLIK